jgi:hypothetical protein
MFSTEFTVTDYPGSNPDQKYVRRRDSQNYIRKNKVKFRTSSKRIPLCVQYIVVQCAGADCKVSGIKFIAVCHAERRSLLLAMGCDRIAALTACKQKHPLKLSAHINRTAVYA